MSICIVAVSSITWLFCQPKQFDHRESGSSPATDYPATNDQTPETQAQGQNFLGMAFANMGIREVLIAPKSPWQNPYCERVIGSIRRDCLDHFIILSENHLYRILKDYMDYYNNYRTHLSLDRNSPSLRDIEPPSKGKVISIPQVVGLHHVYKRVA